MKSATGHESHADALRAMSVRNAAMDVSCDPKEKRSELKGPLLCSSLKKNKSEIGHWSVSLTAVCKVGQLPPK